MLFLTWLDINYICLNFTPRLRLATARCKISTNTMPPHVKMSIKHDMRELFLKQTILLLYWNSSKINYQNHRKIQNCHPSHTKTGPLTFLAWYRCFQHVSKMPTLTYNPENSVIINYITILNIVHNIVNQKLSYIYNISSVKESRWPEPLSKY